MADEGEGRSDAARVGPEAHPQRRADLEHPLRATVDLAARLAAPGDVTKVVQAAADAVVDAFGARLAQVWLAEGPGRLRLAARAGGPLAGDPPSPVMDVATEASLVADVARARLPLVTSDVVGPFAPPLADGPPVAAAALLPMLAEEGEPAGPGRLLGVVAGWFSAPVPVDTADVLSALVSVVAGAVHHADLVERERRGRVDRPAGTGDDREHRLLSFVDSVDAVLLEADPATLQLSFVSRRAEQLLGYPVHRWLEPGFWAATVHPADRDYAVRCSQLAGAQGGDHEFECRMVGADGREVWVQNLVHVDVDDQGNASRLTGLLLDITRRKRVDQALFESRERFASLARTLQASLLPPHLPDISGVEVAARYRPAEDGVEVVGDFYDLFAVGEEGWGVVLGDVCGKGPEAAALTALARYTVRAAAIRERHPSRVLTLLNDAVLAHDSGERYCTAVYARVVPGPGSVWLEVACGGHPPPLVLRSDGSVHRAGRAGTLLGLFDTVELFDQQVELGPGEAIVFFTDGATESKQRGEILGEERLKALVAACAGCPRAEDIVARVEGGIVDFQQGASQDDLALVVLRVPG